MFMLLIVALTLAVFTEAKTAKNFEEDVLLGENTVESPILANEGRDTIR